MTRAEYNVSASLSSVTFYNLGLLICCCDMVSTQWSSMKVTAGKTGRLIYNVEMFLRYAIVNEQVIQDYHISFMHPLKSTET